MMIRAETGPPENESVFDYAPASPERAEIVEALADLSGREMDIPLVIGGREVRTGRTAQVLCPHDHRRVLASFHQAGPKEVSAAAGAAAEAWADWAAWRPEARLDVFRRAAELLSARYRFRLVAATMLNQSKTVHQAEIDAAAELIDFFRLNAFFVDQLTGLQPFSGPAEINRTDLRPLEGFVLAVSPFNFTAIGGNLPSAPAMLGNVCLWKPASSTVFSNYLLMELWQEAGLPEGVINFIPGPGSQVGPAALARPDLAGIHFTGSTGTFRRLWTGTTENLERYRSFPRLVGETGGKDFVVIHPSAEMETTATALIRGAFEFQGQKCSAASRVYAPAGLWPELKSRLTAEMETIKVGDPADFSNFMGAVIDRPAYARIAGYLELAREAADCRIIAGGEADDSSGYFIRPTLVETTDPKHRLMSEEIFGPVLTAYVYPEGGFEEALDLCDRTSPYALTGAVLGRDRRAIETALTRLRFAAGNFYINDKPTGAVVGRQPFGGARASGTNDKAGSILNLLRWTSPRTIKENLDPPRDYRYRFMD